MESKWLEITIETSPGELCGLCHRLEAAGMTGLVIEDEGDFRSFLEQNRQHWDFVDDSLLDKMRGVCRVRFYVTDDSDGRACLRQYAAAAALPYAARPLTEGDWAYSWQKFYRPMAVGERLYIIPEWERETAEVPPGRAALYLNPGLLFGTGSHTSTRLCLEGLERRALGGGSVLDLGCGSGILSIAAMRLGADCAVGVDIDPKAVGVACENAALNGIGRDKFAVYTGDVLSDPDLLGRLAARQYDLILANIVADVIIPLSCHTASMLAEGGAFICSGIIESRACEVANALRQNGLAVTEKAERDGWVAFTAAGDRAM